MIVIVATTYFPEADGVGKQRLITQTLPAVRSWHHWLFVDEDDILLHLADDGSPDFDLYRRDIEGAWNSPDAQRPFSYSQQDRCGVGASLNAGIEKAREFAAEFVLYAVDDWMVLGDFDLTPWVRLMREHEDIGAIRLGHPHPDLTGQIKHFADTWAMRLDRHHYALSMRPTLFHMRFFEFYGLWKENCSAIACEQEYSIRFNETPGPDMYLALPNLWRPLPGVVMSSIDPKRMLTA